MINTVIFIIFIFVSFIFIWNEKSIAFKLKIIFKQHNFFLFIFLIFCIYIQLGHINQIIIRGKENKRMLELFLQIFIFIVIFFYILQNNFRMIYFRKRAKLTILNHIIYLPIATKWIKDYLTILIINIKDAFFSIRLTNLIIE